MDSLVQHSKASKVPLQGAKVNQGLIQEVKIRLAPIQITKVVQILVLIQIGFVQ
jgi:hypothetical protein